MGRLRYSLRPGMSLGQNEMVKACSGHDSLGHTALGT